MTVAEHVLRRPRSIFGYDGRSRLTSAKYTGLSGSCPDGTFTMSQCFAYDRYGNLLSKAGANAVTLTTSTSTNHLTSGSAAYDARGNMTVFSSESMQYDLLNRNYKVTDTTLATDFVYLYDGAGERVGKFPTGGGALRRELARVIIEARGDTSLSCTSNPFTDVVCSSNPNDGKYVQKLKDIGISAGCGGGAYCPDTQIPREQAAVFFLLGKQCTVNVNNCTWTPPACTPPPNQRFADVPCPSTYADWIEELADEGITAGCPGGNFCPTLTLGSFQMLAWASVIWPTYAPLPRNTILTFRDEKGRVASESHQKSSSGDDTEVAIYERDNAFLGNLMISSVVWSGTNWTTPGWQFYSSDHLGSARLTTNTSAATVETKKYWPYGDEAATTGNAAQRLKFASMERDDEANHFYDHARHHDFNMGRFISLDKIGGRPEVPKSWNRYAYGLSNPLKYVDPDGLDVEWFVRTVTSVWRKVTRDRALAVRKAEKDVLAVGFGEKVAAQKLEKEASLGKKILEHGPNEERGYRAHFQTQNREGHTFFGTVRDLYLPFWYWAIGEAVQQADAAAGKYVEEPGKQGVFGKPQRDIDEEGRIEDDKQGEHNQEHFSPNACLGLLTMCFQGATPSPSSGDWLGGRSGFYPW